MAADLKGRDPSGCILDPNSAQITTHTQEECTDEDVRGLIRSGDRSSPPFDSPRLIFSGRYDRKRASPVSRRGLEACQPRSAKNVRLMGFFNIFFAVIYVTNKVIYALLYVNSNPDYSMLTL